jgi:hypothetical protein
MTNLAFVIVYTAALVVLALDLFVWRGTLIVF